MSGLNCRVGDLAVVVGARRNKALIGTLVDVVRPAITGERVADGYIAESVNAAGWVVRRAGGGQIDAWFEAGFSGKADEALCLDRHLRAIRNPGDDAVDETLLWTTPGDRASRNIERCEKLVAEIEGQS